MGELGPYILRVTLTAVLCSVLSSLIPSSGKDWMRLLSGLVLAVTVLAPIAEIRIPSFGHFADQYRQEGRDLAKAGEDLAANSIEAIIIESTQAYILDKASQLGITVTVQVAVSENTIPVPVSVTLWGTVSPYVRLQIEAFLETELGIQKENIQWME